MSEYNIFCYSDDRDNDGLQRPKYQVFNTQLTEEEYSKISIPSMILEFDENEKFKTRYKTAFNKAFQKLHQEDKDKITSLPWFDAEVFKKYWGVDIRKEEEMTLEQVCEELGKNIKIIK